MKFFFILANSYKKIIFFLVAFAYQSLGQTYDLTTIEPTTNTSGGTFEWHNALPISAANLISGTSITQAPVGTYYAVYNFGTCYSTPSQVKIVTNACPETTIDLTAVVDSTNKPAGTVVKFLTNTNPITVYSGDVKTATAGEYYAIYYDGVKGCYSNYTPIIFLNSDCCTKPTNLLAGTPIICFGGSSTLSATCNTGNLKWYLDNKLITEISSPVSPSTTTKYFAVCINGSCTSSADSISITVNQPVVAATLSASDVSVCKGNSTDITVTGCTGTISWDNSISSASATVNVTPLATTTYTATCTVAGTSPCPNVTSTQAITVTVVNPVVAATLSASYVSVCKGNSTNITVSGCSGTITWDNSISATTATVNVSPSATTTYTATCTVAGTSPCPDVTSTQAITVTVVNPVVAATLSASDVSVCKGNSTDITVTGCSGTISWDNSISSASATVTVTPLATTTYTATCTAAGTSPCPNVTSTQAITVTVVEPAVAATLSASDVGVCKGNSTDITVTGCSGTISWDNSISSASATVKVTPLATTTYTATCTVAGTSPCPNVTSTQAITVTVVNPVVAATLSASDVSVCKGNSTNITVSGCTGTISWDNSISSASATVTVTPLATTTYTATCTVAGTSPCPNVTSTQAITVTVVNPVVAATLSASDVSVCKGNSTDITVTGCTGTISWDNSISSASATVTVTPLATTTYTATCTVAGTSPCPNVTSTQAITVTVVEPAVAATLSASDVSVCKGNSTDITVTGCSGTISWDNSISSASATVNVTPLATTTYTATCTVAGTSPCPNVTSTQAITVTVVEPAVAEPIIVSTNNAYICSNSSATLTATGCLTGIVTWSVGSQTGATITVNPSTTTTYTATCTVVATSPCADAVTTNQVTVNVYDNTAPELRFK